jgi:hypothetical protein
MSAFSDLGYREDGPEEVEQVPGSVTSEAYRERLSCRPSSVAHIRATAVGDAEAARIREILQAAGAKRRGQSTTRAVNASPEDYAKAMAAFMRGCV